MSVEFSPDSHVCKYIMSTLLHKFSHSSGKIATVINPVTLNQPMLLRSMFWMVLAFVGAEGLSTWVESPGSLAAWNDILLVASLLIALILLQRGYLRGASLFCVLSQLLLIAVDSILTRELNTFHICAFALLIMITGLLFERTINVIAVAYCTLVTLLGLYLGTTDAGQGTELLEVFKVYGYSYVMLYVAVSIIANLFARQSRYMLQRLTETNLDMRGQALQREQAEIEVRKLNNDLEARVHQRTAELSVANKELEAFAYSVSHDLRAPLRGIDGWSMALLEDFNDTLNDQGREYLNQVRTETQRMSELIDDLLELSRIARSDMRREIVDMSMMAQDLLTQFKMREPERTVEINVQPNLTATGDSHLIRQVLLNLLSNAWKFTGKNEVARIEFGKVQDAFFVKDNGAGFDMTYSNKLFSPFQRLHRASEFPGTGVGLAIVQRVVHRHCGEIWAESTVGQGTTFFFTLQTKKSPTHLAIHNEVPVSLSGLSARYPENAL